MASIILINSKLGVGNGLIGEREQYEEVGIRSGLYLIAIPYDAFLWVFRQGAF